MFATLLGGLPEPPVDAGATPSSRLEAMVRAQEAAGLDPITDGGPPAADDRRSAELAATWIGDAATDGPDREGDRRWTIQPGSSHGR